MKIPLSVSESIADYLGSQIVGLSNVGGGCISRAASIRLADGRECFLKWNDSAPSGFFAAEAFGLLELKKSNTIRVPEVYSYSDPSSASAVGFILLEALKSSKRCSKAERDFGHALALLHNYRSDHIGLPQDNFIGTLEQKNSPQGAYESWGEFFFHYRLVVQAELGMDNGWCDVSTRALLYEKKQLIITRLNEVEEPPSLLHGDLWSGNVFWTSDGPALIDPAVYYGHREADIAFLYCFGDPGPDFRAAYEEVLPIAEGFPERMQILNLYHMMTHSNLFGGSYIRSVKNGLGLV